MLSSWLGASDALWSIETIRRLRELGWIEGRTIAIEYRWAEGHRERFAEIATEFARLNVDIIVTYATEPAIAAKRATSVIPIGVATAGDPVGTGLVASLARPGGNLTGLSNQQADLAGKRLEFLREMVPRLLHLRIMGNVNSPASARQSLRQRQGRELHEDAQGRSRVSDGIRNL
jgi:putative ABC transport system substrate-binding protein